jgi:hypothetical protein
MNRRRLLPSPQARESRLCLNGAYVSALDLQPYDEQFAKAPGDTEAIVRLGLGWHLRARSEHDTRSCACFSQQFTLSQAFEATIAR